MDLYRDILVNLLQNEAVDIRFPNLQFPIDGLIEMECYQVLKKIKAIIEDDSLEDCECFMKIEQIVCALEEIGSNGGGRHDFG